MAKVVRNLVYSVLCVLLVALLAITFTVMQRNSFDAGDIVADLPLLAMIWIAFGILAVGSLRLTRGWHGDRKTQS